MNPDPAAWCNQCFRDLRAAGSPAAGGRATAAARGGATVDPAADAGDTVVADKAQVVDPVLSTEAAVDAPVPATSTPPPGGARQRAPWLNTLVPGLGHVVAGWAGSGLARMVLYGTWLVGGLLVLVAGQKVVALPLLAGAAVLWITAVWDGWRLRAGARQLVSGRVLLWLVIAIAVATMGAVGTALLTA